MSEKAFKGQIGSAKQDVVMLTGVVSIGTSGAVSSDTIPRASVANAATARYTITLDDKYTSLEGFSATFFNNGTGADLVPQLRDVSLSSKTITFSTLTAASESSNPASGTKIYITLFLKNSSL